MKKKTIGAVLFVISMLGIVGLLGRYFLGYSRVSFVSLPLYILLIFLSFYLLKKGR